MHNGADQNSSLCAQTHLKKQLETQKTLYTHLLVYACAHVSLPACQDIY